jgi:hypothetical protein
MSETEKPTSKDPYQDYKDFKWQNPEEIKNGPVSDETRKCRDIFCCIFFIIFIAACIAVAVLGFHYGNPSYFLYVYDEDGNACGKDGEYKDYPYLYFYQVISNAKTLKPENMINGICVRSCPENDLTVGVDPLILDCKSTTNNPNCEISVENYYESKPILNRICFPKQNDEIKYDTNFYRAVEIYDPETGETFTKIVHKDDVKELDDGVEYIKLTTIKGENSQDSSARLINWSFFSVDRLSTWLSDLYVTRWAIVGSLAWSFIVAMIYLLLLRLIAGVLVFFVIILILAGLIILAAYFKITANDHEELDDNVYFNAYTALFWVFLVLAILWIIFVIAMCNRIRLAVALLQITAKYINKVWCIIFVPFFFFIIVIIWMGYWISLSIFLYATGEFNKEGSKVIANFDWDAKIRYSWWFHLFALFYMTAIISAFASFIYSSSACIWYFTSERGIEAHPIIKSFKRGLLYHFGSIAFGSLIIAIVRLIMVWFEYIKKRVESTTNKKTESKCFKCIFSCLQCCVGCIGKIMEYVNRHAYIQIALKGDNFCTAAWEGFGLIIRNLGRFSILSGIGSVFTVIGTVFISVISAIIGYFIITKVSYFSDELNSCVLPVVVFIIIGLVLGLVTMNIFGTSGEALMHSFLLDEEINKGQPKAFPELQKFMSDER